MAQNQNPATSRENKIREIQEGAKGISKRIGMLRKTEEDVEEGINRRNKELKRMWREYGSEIRRLKQETASMQKQVFALAHNLKVAINQLKNTARQQEFEKLKERINHWAPFDKATKDNTQEIIKESRGKG